MDPESTPPPDGALEVPVVARNEDALPFACILWGWLPLVDTLFLFQPHFERAVAFTVVYVGLTARYFVLLSCRVEPDRLVFRWPLRTVVVTAESLTYAKHEGLWPGGINLRTGVAVPFGLSLQRWRNRDALVVGLQRVLAAAPQAQRNPREIRRFLTSTRRAGAEKIT